MFLTDDEKKAYELANYLCEENTIRQQTEQTMFKEALEYIENHPEMKDDKVLIIPHENWHHGIVGIVASKFVEKYYKPTFIMNYSEETKMFRCSARGVKELNLYEIISVDV